MGPSHDELRARRAMKDSHPKPTLPLCAISEVDEPATVVNVSVYESDTSDLSSSISALEVERRSVDDRLRIVQGLAENGKAAARKDASSKESVNRQAISLQTRLATLMNSTRQMDNRCCRLTYATKGSECHSSYDTRKLQKINEKLQDMATDIERTHGVVERERKQALTQVEKPRETRLRKRRERHWLVSLF